MQQDQIQHRKVIEDWLMQGIKKERKCGCSLDVEWEWPGYDWIFPVSVSVFCIACNKHTAVGQEFSLRQTLTNRLVERKKQSFEDFYQEEE